MTKYEDLALKIAAEKQGSIVELDFANQEHYHCIVSLFGSESKLQTDFRRLYQIVQATKEEHKLEKNKAKPIVDDLEDSLFICNISNQESVVGTIGAVSLTSRADVLYTTITIYQNGEQIGRTAMVEYDKWRTIVQCSAEGLPEGDIDVVLHETWIPAGGNSMRSSILNLQRKYQKDDVVKSVDIIHPSISTVPHTPPAVPPMPWGKIEQSVACQGDAKKESYVNICYQRSPLEGEHVDYIYPGIVKSEQELYLDVQGEVHLNKTTQAGESVQLEFDKYVRVSIALDTPYGGVIADPKNVNASNFLKTSDGFRFAFPTDWGKSIPGHKLAGRHLCSLDVYIDFKCVGDAKDTFHTVFITSEPHYIEDNISALDPHCKTIPRIKLNWGCMAADTRVLMADGSSKEVQAIKIGDLVRSEKGHVAVTNIMVGTEAFLWHIKAADAEIIKVTGEHPFITRNGMKAAVDLEADDELLLEDGSYSAVQWKFEMKNDQKVYNLMLDGNVMYAERYCVGDQIAQGEAMMRKSEGLVTQQCDSDLKAECDKLLQWLTDGQN